MKEIYESQTTVFPKKKTVVIAPVFVILLCVILYAIFIKPTIEQHTWELYIAQQAEPFFVVAHHQDYDVSGDDTLFAISKPIDLACVAKNGKLTIMDKTNNKTYSGTYKVKSWRFQRYDITIEGKTGTANINKDSLFNRTLFMSIDGYYLNFQPR